MLSKDERNMVKAVALLLYVTAAILMCYGFYVATIFVVIGAAIIEYMGDIE